MLRKKEKGTVITNYKLEIFVNKGPSARYIIGKLSKWYPGIRFFYRPGNRRQKESYWTCIDFGTDEKRLRECRQAVHHLMDFNTQLIMREMKM